MCLDPWNALARPSRAHFSGWRWRWTFGRCWRTSFIGPLEFRCVQRLRCNWARYPCRRAPRSNNASHPMCSSRLMIFLITLTWHPFCLILGKSLAEPLWKLDSAQNPPCTATMSPDVSPSKMLVLTLLRDEVDRRYIVYPFRKKKKKKRKRLISAGDSESSFDAGKQTIRCMKLD